MANSSSKVSSSTRAKVENIVKDMTFQNISEYEKIQFLNFKKECNNFLENLTNKSKMELKNANIIKKMIGVKSDTETFYGRMKFGNSQYTQDILAEQHKFELALDNFLNRQILLTYVDETGNIIAHDAAATAKIYQQATANRGRGNINKKVIKKIINKDARVKDINIEIKNSLEGKQQIYTESIKRWEEEININGNKVNKHIYAYWNTPDFYSKYVSQKGDIAEGFVGAVLSKANISNSNLEASIKILGENFIYKDNIPAAVKGDIIYNLGGNGIPSIQFAVKEGDFSTAKIGQYISLAYHISNLSEQVILSKNNLEKALPTLTRVSGVSNHLLVRLEEKARQEAEKVISVDFSS